MNCSSYEFGDLGFHNFRRLRGLGGQGDKLGILRRWDLRGWGGKMRPAGSEGEMVLSSCPVSSRPRLSALIPLAPEPRHGCGHRTKALWTGPGIIPNRCHPCLFTIPSSEVLTYFPFGCIMNYGFLLFLRKGDRGAGSHRAPGYMPSLS